MYRLSFVLILLFSGILFSQTSPHGSNLKFQCEDCHSEVSWNIIPKNINFDHNQTGFKLESQHKVIDCKQCHSTLKFEEVNKNCVSCHNNIHQNTVDIDCQKCHTTDTWLVKNIREIHNQSRFPLLGVHQSVNCVSCHPSYPMSRFEVLSIDCFDCHRKDYQQAKNPDHIAANFSTDCIQCHSIEIKSWGGKNFTHLFFPLTGGHNISNCNSCHNQNSFTGLDTKCVSCHLSNYQNTQNPNHSQLGFSTDCETCHKITNWHDASFDHDNLFFPIYSGKHKGKWNTCNDCHTNQNNYAEFSCLNCHEHNKNDMDDKHRSINGYVYNSPACLSCHPNGDGDNAFNHDLTSFKLTGAHTNIECAACHQSGFQNTPIECFGCHQNNFNQAINPNHIDLNFPTNCETCHTTNSGWKPAQFQQHNNFFELTGAHLNASCENCHNGNYTSIAFECSNCHIVNFNQTQNPNHQQIGISNQCSSCHNSTAWTPSTFNHSNTQFVLSGAHTTINCTSCHQGQTTGTSTECSYCHIDDFNQTQNPNHQQIGISNQCSSCHNSTAWIPSSFSHSNTTFPLAGVHTQIFCSDCHQEQTTGTSTDCYTCHQTQYEQSNNPNHVALNLPTTCATCHTIEPQWEPATFPIHNNFYQLTGQHNSIKDNCTLCHNGNYNSTPNQCNSCHINDYNNTTNPNHLAAKFPQECEICHNTNGWIPSTFNHDQQYFPIYSGAHKNKWDNCLICHTDQNNYSVFSCLTCHEHNQTEMNQKHIEVSDYQYNSEACLNCHPNGSGDKIRKSFLLE